MITLYFAPMTRSIRIMWLLEELGLDYTLRHVAFQPSGERAFAQHTPSGKLPVIEDDGVVVGESGAIVEYLVERYGDGRLAPPIGSPLRPRYLEWLHATEATMAPPINSYVWLTVYRDDTAHLSDFVAQFRANAEQNFDRLEAALSEAGHILGDDFSAADVMIGFTLWSAKMVGLLGDRHPRTLAYYRRLAERPAFAKALAESLRAADAGIAAPERTG